jgi:hypothetical protein
LPQFWTSLSQILWLLKKKSPKIEKKFKNIFKSSQISIHGSSR